MEFSESEVRPATISCRRGMRVLVLEGDLAAVSSVCVHGRLGPCMMHFKQVYAADVTVQARRAEFDADACHQRSPSCMYFYKTGDAYNWT